MGETAENLVDQYGITREESDRYAMETQLRCEAAREAGKFLREYSDEPFFLVASFMKPHPPFFPPKAWADRYPPDGIDLRPIGDTSGYPRHIRERIAKTQGAGEARIRAYRASITSATH